MCNGESDTGSSASVERANAPETQRGNVDSYNSKPLRLVAFLIVVVPVVAIVGFAVALRTDFIAWGGAPWWQALLTSVVAFVVVPLLAGLIGLYFRDMKSRGAR